MKPLANFEGYYEISDAGAIHSIRSKKFLRSTLKPNGYVYIELNVNGRATYHRLHRLVAETYIPNPESKPFVNHINGDKADNRVENLEWVTGTENNNHAVDNGLVEFTFNIYKITCPKGYVTDITGIHACAKFCNVSTTTVTKYVRLGKPTRNGYLIERATTIRHRSTPKRVEIRGDSLSS
jgi:hypothetical protein